MRAPLAAGLVLSLAAAASAQEPREEGVAVTVYSAPGGQPYQPQQVFNPMTGQWEFPSPGFSVVKERRRMTFQSGVNTLRFDRVAAGIDASTVVFRSLTDPAGTSVLEQSFQYDLASADRILEKYLGRDVEVMLKSLAEHKGRLLSFDAVRLVVDQGGEVVILDRDNLNRIALKSGSAGLVTKPTLVWMVNAGQAGDHLVEAAYETSGMSWVADYTAVVSPDDAKVDLSAWVTIRNQSGASYEDAALKLVAGDLNRVPKQSPYGAYDGTFAMAESRAGAPPGFTEKAFFEYHLYTLGRRTTLPDRSLKQIELFDPVSGIPCRKVFLYDGARDLPPWYNPQANMDESFGRVSNRKVGVYLEIDNRKEAGLGMPLPAGRMRLHKRDEADGFPELIGEDRIDHTPKDEKVRLKVGDAFDVVGERRQVDFKADYNGHWITESFEIKVRNHKDQPVEVLVKERLYRWVNWEIQKPSTPFEKKDSQVVHFPVKVPKDGEAVVTYTVRYTW